MRKYNKKKRLKEMMNIFKEALNCFFLKRPYEIFYFSYFDFINFSFL